MTPETEMTPAELKFMERTPALRPRKCDFSPEAAFKPGPLGAPKADPCDGGRRVLLTCVLAMYPLAGSITILLAGLMLAAGGTGT